MERPLRVPRYVNERRYPNTVTLVGMRRGWAVAVGALMLVACGGQNGPTQPPSATHVTFTVQPSNTAAGAAITPAVQVAVQDAQGNTVTRSEEHTSELQSR